MHLEHYTTPELPCADFGGRPELLLQPDDPTFLSGLDDLPSMELDLNELPSQPGSVLSPRSRVSSGPSFGAVPEIQIPSSSASRGGGVDLGLLFSGSHSGAAQSAQKRYVTRPDRGEKVDEQQISSRTRYSRMPERKALNLVNAEPKSITALTMTRSCLSLISLLTLMAICTISTCIRLSRQSLCRHRFIIHLAWQTSRHNVLLLKLRKT